MDQVGASLVQGGGKREAEGAKGIEKVPFSGEAEDGLGKVPLREAVSDDEPEETLPEDEDELPDAEGFPKRRGRMILKMATLMLFTALVVGGVYLWLFPEVRIQALEWVSPWLRTIPGSEMILGAEDAKKREIAAAPIRIKDIRQRSVTNLLSGNLRILEGVAVNQSSTPLARIRVRMVISDAYDVVLGEKTVFCGNLLTDAELSTLAESEIQRELSHAAGERCRQ